MELELRLSESGGELTPEVETMLTQLKSELTQKIDAYQFFTQEVLAITESLDARIKELTKLKKGYENAAERVMYGLRDYMLEQGLREIEGGRTKARILWAKDALILDPETLDPTYVMHVTKTEPDKERIRTDLESGVEVPGAHLRPSPYVRLYPSNTLKKEKE